MKKVGPTICDPLIDALVASYWFKKQLRRFFERSSVSETYYGGLDWEQTKRVIAGQVVDKLYRFQPQTTDELIGLISEVALIRDPYWLKATEDGEQKYESAIEALDKLRAAVTPYEEMMKEADAASEKRRLAYQEMRDKQAKNESLSFLKVRYLKIIAEEAQKRGYLFERLLYNLFAFYDLDPKGPFQLVGEQIDGAFTFDRTEYLLEAKWKMELTPAGDLHIFTTKVQTKLENTLGLFVSMNGFQQTAVDAYSSRQSSIILMDGSDLMCILDDRISLPDLLERKRQHAARTGGVLLRASEILS
jgi:hypothetical protein